MILISSSVFAEEEQQVISPVLPCNEWEVIAYNIVHEYNEVPAADGTGALTMPNQVTFGGTVVIFINKDSGTYTIVYRDTESNLACILAAGENFAPAGKKYLEILGDVKL